MPRVSLCHLRSWDAHEIFRGQNILCNDHHEKEFLFRLSCVFLKSSIFSFIWNSSIIQFHRGLACALFKISWYTPGVEPAGQFPCLISSNKLALVDGHFIILRYFEAAAVIVSEFTFFNLKIFRLCRIFHLQTCTFSMPLLLETRHLSQLIYVKPTSWVQFQLQDVFDFIHSSWLGR